MTAIIGTEKIVNPLQISGLNKKGLCDYVINLASGCLHGCTFCYVPSTPAIRTRKATLCSQGVHDPQLDWGSYLFLRDEIPEKLDALLSRKRTWQHTDSGKGVVMLCSGTDPYQNQRVATITRKTIEVLLKYRKEIRLLTRSPLWVNDLDILQSPNITVGMSLPHLDDQLSRKIEPFAPPPSTRLQALQQGHAAGCRVYVAIAPTPPHMGYEDFLRHLEQIMVVDPEVIFWEPINARGTNGQRMRAAGLDFADDIMTKDSWARVFLRQWEDIERAAAVVGCLERLHIWVDAALNGYVRDSTLQQWFYRPTCERWGAASKTIVGSAPTAAIQGG